MAKRTEHTFQFKAAQIAAAAQSEAQYHEERATYWQDELDKAFAQVEKTMSAKIVKQQHTGGWTPQVSVDYGDPVAHARMQLAGAKIQSHQKAAESFRSDEMLYTTQGQTAYNLDTADVQHYRLGGGPREE